jgi:hypothetical protein
MAVIAVFAACGDDDASPTSTPTALVVDGEPPYYMEPIPIATGEPPTLNQTWGPVATRGPIFVGEINGFRLYQPGDFENERVPCGGADYAGFEEVEVFQLHYIPENSYVLGPQSASICPDGKMSGAYQDFDRFQVAYLVGERAFHNTAPEGAIVETEIQGRPAIVISRLGVNDINFIDTKVAFQTENGFVLVDARRMPTETAVEIAAAIACPDC